MYKPCKNCGWPKRRCECRGKINCDEELWNLRRELLRTENIVEKLEEIKKCLILIAGRV